MGSKRTVILGAATSVLIAALGLSPGCIPYSEPPETEPWVSSNFTSHLAVVFNGEGDSSTQSFDFEGSDHMARLVVSNALECGTVTVVIRIKATDEVLCDFTASPGFGPHVQLDLYKGLPGTYSVTVTSFEAKGTFSLNLDDYPDDPSSLIGFHYQVLFPDQFGPVLDRTETYHFHDHDGSATLTVSSSLPDTSQIVTVEVYDDSATPVLLHTFTYNTGDYPIDSTDDHTQALGGVSGNWSVVIRHQNTGTSGNDGSVAVTVQ